MTARIPCCVPFCKRTTGKGAEGSEFMCGKHGMMASKPTRLLWRRLARKATRALENEGPNSTPDEIHLTDRLCAIQHKAWQKFKAEAIEAAGGLR